MVADFEPFRTIGVIDARDFHELLISQIVAQLHHDGRKCLALDRDADLTNSFNEFDNSISQQGVDGISHTFVGGIFGCGTAHRSEEHTSELQSLMRISYAVFCLKKQTTKKINILTTHTNAYEQYTTEKQRNTITNLCHNGTD